ncbi:MAG: glycosyl transferase family 1 [Gemmatimonadetes bacterium]|nr:glycosyl transferase family 1 [Gemmatimonadota bacterium]
MRVLHLYSGNRYGGIESVLVTLARHRAQAPEMEPVFALAFEGRVAGELRNAGGEVHVVGPTRLSRPVSVWRTRRRLSALLAAGGFDVALAHAPWSMAVYGPAVRRHALPLAFWMHDAVGAGDRVERRARRVRPALALCNSAFTASTLPRIYPDVPAEVVHPPVPPPPAFDRARVRAQVHAELSTAAEDVVVVQVGRMEAWKGHARLLAALGSLRDVDGWTAWIVGGAQRTEEAAYVEELRRTAAALGIADRIRFTGERADVARVLAAADVACQPNASPEPFGVAIVEALYASLPVVATASGGALEIVTPECGALVPPDDVAALSGSLRRLFVDVDERNRLAAAGPARACAVADVGATMRKLAHALAAISRKAEA